MEMIERLVITYPRKMRFWMTSPHRPGGDTSCQVCSVTAPPQYLHVLWVMAFLYLLRCSLSQVCTNALRVDGRCSKNRVRSVNANTNSCSLEGAGGSSPKFSPRSTKLPRQPGLSPFVPRPDSSPLAVRFIYLRNFFIYPRLCSFGAGAWQSHANACARRTLGRSLSPCTRRPSGGIIVQKSRLWSECPSSPSNDFPSPVVVGIWRPRLISAGMVFSSSLPIIP